LVTQGLPGGATFPHGTTNEQVTVTDKAGNFTAGNFSVTVNKILVSISVTPSSATLTAAQSNQQFTATGTFSDESTQPLSAGGGAWAPSGTLATPRFYHTATLLQDGTVLVVGGYNGSSTFASAERYYPASGTWVPAGSMATARLSHSATLLPNGKVLVAGGIIYTGSAGTLTNTTELYDPSANSWSAGPPLTLGVRSSHSAVLLGSGKVLVVAGLQSYPDCTYRATAELYDPATNTWAATGSLHLARSSATTTLLASGKVLLAGGPQNGCPTPNSGLNEAEVYDPVSGTWAVTGTLSLPRFNNSITRLPNGKVLLAGGYAAVGTIATADLFDPTTGSFSLTGSLATARAATGGSGDNGDSPLLQNGQVLFAGGYTSAGSILGNTELYNPASGTWTTTGSLTTARAFDTATLLPDGHVLVVGGYTNGSIPLASTELYTPPAVSWSSSNGSVASINQSGLATALASGTTTISASSGGISGSASVTVDKAAPTTTATPSPAPNGAGWNDTDVTVALHATDDAGGTGVQAITYSLSGAQSGGGTFNTASTSFLIANEGITTVTYHATDVSGNVEADHTLTIKLDKTAPSVPNLPNLTVPATSTLGAVVNINVSSSDTLSGIATVTVTPIASGSTFPHGTTNETVTVTDAAGNTTTRNFSVTVNRTLVSIAVSPPTSSVHPGQGQSFTATGTFTDGTTQVLPSGGSGGGFFGPGSPAWQVFATPGMEFAPCATSQYPLTPGGSAFTSQNFFDFGGAVHQTWSPGTPVVTIDGTINASDVALTLACTNGAATGTINAHWNGSRYEGTFSFNGGASTSHVSITGWSGQAPMPTARFGVGGASANGKVYAIGGVGGSCNGSGPCSFGPLTTVESYNPGTNSWAAEPSLSVGRESAGVAAIGNTIYVVGGHVPGGDPSGVVEVFSGSSWTTLPQSDWMPTARAGLALVTDGTYLYAIGGNTQANNTGPVATVERYNPSAPPGSRWTTLAPMPAAGNASGAGVLNQTIVVVGSDGTNRTDVYDIASGTWHSGAPMPAQRGAMAAGVANGGLWLVGGTANGSLAYDTWVYYPATTTGPDRWWGVGSMLTGRLGLTAAVVDDVVYAIGGAATSSGAILGLSTNESLSTPPFSNLPSPGPDSQLTVQWQSTNPAVADVDAGGFAHVNTIGQTTIVASAGSVSCQTTNSCATLTGTNAAPTVQITGAASGPGPTPPFVPGPFSIGEGVQLQLNATASDPDGDPLTYAWSLVSGGGTLNTFGPPGPSASYTNGDGPSAATVQVTVTDSFGATATATANITVNNVAPAVQIFGGPFTTSESQFQNLNSSGSFFDRGASDGLWTATVDYGDGTGVQSLPFSQSSSGFGTNGNFSLNHRYADNGTFTVTVAVEDKDLGKGTATATVVVNNAAPQVFLPMSASTVVGSTNDFGCASFNDQGSADAPWTATVNYGDGSGDQPVALTIPGSCGGGGTTVGRFNLNHAYLAGGTYTVTVRVTDKDLGAGQASTTVSVNAAPLVTINPIGPVNEGSTMSGGGSFTDGPGDGPWTIRITYGDNTGQFQLPQTSSPFTFSHVYKDNGSYLVTVQVTDRLFATGTTSMLVTVNNVAPSVTLPPSAGPIAEGQQMFVTANFFDPGLNDGQSPGFSATVNYGDGTPPQSFANLGFNSSSGTGSFSFNHTYVDNPAAPATAFIVTVTVTDKNGATSTPATMPVTVVNSTPSVTLFPPSRISQGMPATFTGFVSDQGAADGPWTGRMDFGDGTLPVIFTTTPGAPPGSPQNARASFTLTHTYAQSGNFNLTVSATDKDGATTSLLAWTTMAPDPHAKYTPVAAAINGKLYVHGFDSSFVARLGIYDPSSNTWSNGSSPTLVRSYSSVGGINGKMYVAGGCILSDCSSPTNELRIYDTFTNQWSTGAAMPTVRFGAAAGVINGKLYVTGGTLAGYISTNVTEIYDPALNSWTTGTPIPVARELAMSAVSNNELYVIGGYERGAVNGPVGRVDVFNPSTGWSTRSPMPTARSAGLAGAIDGSIYVAGGAAAGGVFLNSNERYDPFSDTWTAEAPTPTARVYTSGGAVNSKLYVIDGYDGGPLSTNEAFNPNTSLSIRVRPVLVSLAIAPASATRTAIGQTVQFIATATFSDGSTQSTSGDPDEGVIWTSSNPGVATIVPGGLATAVGPGATIIRADAEDAGNTFHAEALLSVDSVPPVITANDVSAEATSAAGATVSFAFSAIDDLDSHPTVTADHLSGASYPIGTTNVLVTASDAAGNVSTRTLHVVVADSTPPTLTLSGNITTDATSPAGVVVTYSSAATDIVSGAVAVNCVPPSGSTFPIGMSTVTCTATDGAGNTASGSIQVLVQAAAAQVANLVILVQDFNLVQNIANSLDAKLQNILSALNAAQNGSVANVCGQLNAFVNETQAQSGKKLTVAQADQLIVAATRIEAVIGCQ
jgi:N-acetylneuraminic acid mutarotase